MINRTKIFTIALTGALAAVALTGCGGSASSSAAPSSVSTAAAESPASSAAASAVVDNAAENGSDALNGVFNALLEADPISNQFEIAAMNIEYDFGLKAEDVAAYKGVKSNDNGDAGLVLVVEAASGKAQDDRAGELQAGSGGFLRQLRRVCTGTEQRGKRHHLLQGRPCGHGDRLQRVLRRPEQCCGQRPEQLNLTF